MAPRKNKAEDTSSNVDDQLEAELNERGLHGIVRFADQMEEDIECVSTGFPSLDNILHTKNLGLARGRITELYSRSGSAGKTSLAVQIAASFQKQGFRVGFLEPESTLTKSYVHRLGVVTDPKADPDKYAMRWVRPENGLPWSAEQYLDAAQKMADVMDLLVIDSIASLIPEAEVTREISDDPAMGERARLLSRFLPKVLHKRASLLFINQSRTTTGGKSYMGPSYVTPGGKAMDFYSSLRIELSMVQKLKLNQDSEPYGMEVKAYTAKNKLSPPFRSTSLTYIYGDGFTDVFDYLNMGIKSGVVEKSGAWYSAFGERIGQGKMQAYETLKSNAELMDNLRKAVDGESATEDSPSETAA